MTRASGWTARDRLLVRAATCTVLQAEPFADCEALHLEPSAPPDTPFGPLLLPFDRPRRIDIVPSPRAVRRRRWLHAVRRAGARQHPFGALRAAARATVDLLPYQLEPALAILRHGALRVLLADAVGLGKTIQAGLVLAEVLDRDSSRRALVLMPAGLRHQWKSELAMHFRIDAHVCDADWLRHRVRDLPPDANPWALPGTYVVSLDFIKRAEVLNAIEGLLWDIVIVDEAHVVTGGTDRRAAVEAVAARARRVLLLSGTPHTGDEAQFDALCRIGETPARTPLVVFRRTRPEVGSNVPRRSALLRVRPSEAERRMHELLERYAARLWHEAGRRGDRRARLVAIVLRKRGLSSAASLAASVARRIDLLAGACKPDSLQLCLPLQDADDETDDEVRDDVLGAPGLPDPVKERRWLGALLGAARHAARHESKITRLRRLLRYVPEPAIVFTEYRDTLVRLHRVLENRQQQPVLTLHGGMSAAEREAVQHTFNDRPSLLLATDAAAEGLNLQQRCRLVIHFELPWNPLRLEQRTGRVDRIGQTRRVHEIALVAHATAEGVVLAPLARRIANAKELATSGGRMLELLNEAAVAAAVMAEGNEHLAPPRRVPVLDAQPKLTREAAEEASRLSEERQWLASVRTSHTDERPVVTVWHTRGRRAEECVILVYTLSLVTAAAQVAHSEPLVVRLVLRSGLQHVRTPAGARRALDDVLRCVRPRLERLIESRFAALETLAASRHKNLLASLRQRELAIAGVRTSAARQLVQAGLFDRRAVRDAAARQGARESRALEADENLRSLSAAEHLTRSVRLDAALLRREASA